MTFIPNVRDKTIRKPFSSKEIFNEYWEGNLNKEQKERLEIYDMAVDQAMSFFDNIDLIRSSNLMELLLLDTDLVANSDKASKSDIAKANCETREAIAIKNQLRDWLEAQRNNFVVSMLEERKR